MPMFALMCCFLAKAPKVGTFHAFNEGRGSGYTIWKPVLAQGARKLDRPHSGVRTRQGFRESVLSPATTRSFRTASTWNGSANRRRGPP